MEKTDARYLNEPMTPREPIGGIGVSMTVEDMEAPVEGLQNEGASVLLETQKLSTCDLALVIGPDVNQITLHQWSDSIHRWRDQFPNPRNNHVSSRSNSGYAVCGLC